MSFYYLLSTLIQEICNIIKNISNPHYSQFYFMGNENDKNLSLFELGPKTCCDNFSLYITDQKVQSSDVSCSVCFTVFCTPRILKCKHIFCQDCIHEWAKENKVSCPFCRLETKRTRGSYGRVDKRLENKISKLVLKCRNCCWSGSYFQFISQFSAQPYLDEQYVPSVSINEEKSQRQQEKVEEKVEIPEKNIEAEQRTQTKARSQKQQKQSVAELIKRSQTSQGYSLFVGTVLGLDQLMPPLNPFVAFLDDALLQNQILQAEDNINLEFKPNQ